MLNFGVNHVCVLDVCEQTIFMILQIIDKPVYIEMLNWTVAAAVIYLKDFALLPGVNHSTGKGSGLCSVPTQRAVPLHQRAAV